MDTLERPLIDKLKRQHQKLVAAWKENNTPENLAAARNGAAELRAARKQEESQEDEKATILMSALQERSHQPASPAPVRKKPGPALVDPEDRKPGRGTGVKHIRPTISGFAHPPADKSEALLNRLNLRTNDPLSSGGGSGAGLTAGEILSAFAFELVPVPNIEKLIGRLKTKQLVQNLIIYKHAGDRSVHSALVLDVWGLIIQLAKRDGWVKAETDERPLHVIENCSVVVIEHLCAPAVFRDLSDRKWAMLLGLEGGHREWDRKWENRYRQIINTVQDAEIAGEEQIRRRV